MVWRQLHGLREVLLCIIYLLSGLALHVLLHEKPGCVLWVHFLSKFQKSFQLDRESLMFFSKLVFLYSGTVDYLLSLFSHYYHLYSGSKR